MKYSVIIPAYNCQRFVGECIESILSQTYKNFEIIIVDDGSTDNTLAICRSYEALDKRVKVIHKKNGGPFSARVAAYSEITGDYVLHVDADDCLRSDALEKLFPFVSQESFDVIFFEYSSSADFSTMEKRFPFNCSRSFECNQKSVYLNLAFNSFCLYSMWSKVFRASILLDMRYPSEALQLVSGEDHLQSLFLLDRVKKAYYLMEPLYFYRDNATGTTNSFRLDDYRDLQIRSKYYKLLLSKWKKLPNFGISDESLDSYILVAIYRYLQAALKYGGHRLYREAANLISSSDLFIRVASDKLATATLRIDMRIVFRLLLINLINLSEVLLRLVILFGNSHVKHTR